MFRCDQKVGRAGHQESGNRHGAFLFITVASKLTVTGVLIIVTHHQVRKAAMKTSVLTATVLLLALAQPAGAEDSYDSGPASTHATAAGTVLTNPMGMTLYTYDRDTAGSSNCTGSCAQH